MYLLPFFLLLSPFLITSNALEDSDFFEIKIDRDHPNKIYEEFEEFIVKYKRKYKNPAEKQMRMKNFIKWRNTIEKFNQASNKSGHSVHFGINQFSDLSKKEFQSRLSKIVPARANSTKPIQTRHKREDLNLFPKKFDLRNIKVNNKYITSDKVKDQGNCGCCWGFAATAVAETVYAASLGRFTELSEQELCDCATDGTLGCSGGQIEWGMGHIFGNGLASNSDYKWEETRANETGMCASFETPRKFPEGKFDFYGIRNYQPEFDIMSMLTEWKSPVAVAFAVGERFRTYKSGTLYVQDCRQEKVKQFHAGAIIGYGEEKVGRNVMPYWIVKNSWGGGDSWGDNGYFKVIRGANWCGMERDYTAFGARIADHTHA